MTRLAELHREIAQCRACPRLVSWREQVGREKRRADGALLEPAHDEMSRSSVESHSMMAAWSR